MFYTRVWSILRMFYTWDCMHKEIFVTSKMFYFMVAPIVPQPPSAALSWARLDVIEIWSLFWSNLPFGRTILNFPVISSASPVWRFWRIITWSAWCANILTKNSPNFHPLGLVRSIIQGSRVFKPKFGLDRNEPYIMNVRTITDGNFMINRPETYLDIIKRSNLKTKFR